MKKIEATFQPFKLDEIKEALRKQRVQRLTVCEVKGAGHEKAKMEYYRGVQYLEDAPEVKLGIIADDAEVDQVLDVIVSTLRDGGHYEGQILILPMERVVRVHMNYSA